MQTNGTHVIADIWLDESLPMKHIKSAQKKSAEQSGLKIVGECFKDFGGEAFTGVLILAESHYSIHYFPERAFMAVDCYTCGNEGDPIAAVSLLAGICNPVKLKLELITRG